jgi:hypothetical protein
MFSRFTFEANFVINKAMRVTHPSKENVEEANNRLVNHPQVSSYQFTNGALFVDLMQAPQKTQKQAKENSKEAILNKTSMPDNNGDRIIYTLINCT